MVIKKIIVSKGVTVSVGKFESLRFDASLEIGTNEDDDSDTVFETGFELCDEQINKQIEEVQDIVASGSVFKVDKKESTSSKRRRK